MKQWGIIGTLLAGLSLCVSGCKLWQHTSAILAVTSTVPPELDVSLRYQKFTLDRSIVHLLVIPAQAQFQVVPALSAGVDQVEHLAQERGAIAAINSGYFDPINSKTTSTVIVNGQLVADPQQNERLTDNPNLSAYLPQISNRSEFRRYQCKTEFRYAIVRRQTPTPTGCRLVDAVGGGPQLLPSITATAEGFWNADTGRDPIGVLTPNARTAIGIRANGDVLWVIATQIPGEATSGLTLTELFSFFVRHDAVSALNLDGGSSTALYYQGETFYGGSNQPAAQMGRPVKSVLLLMPVSKTTK